MSQRKQLLEVTYHSDDDTGMYQVGEIDFGINGRLDEYLRGFGVNGYKEIILTLAYLSHEVHSAWEKISQEGQKCVVAERNANETPTP